jgi:tRNA 2-thiouridine synthesizing protein A
LPQQTGAAALLSPKNQAQDGTISSQIEFSALYCMGGSIGTNPFFRAFLSSRPSESSFLAGECFILSRLPTGNARRMSEVNGVEIVQLDATGLECPMPLLKAKRALNTMSSGQQLCVLATDQGSVRDFRVFAEQSGHLLLVSDETDGVYRHLIQKS